MYACLMCDLFPLTEEQSLLEMKRIQEEEQRRVTELKKALEEKENILTQKVNVTCNLYMDELTNFSSFFYSSFSYSNWKKVRLKTNCAE